MIIIEKTIKTFAVGVELGQPAEGTAIAVVELVHSPSSLTDRPSDQPGLHLRHLPRFLPGTCYADIAQGLSDLLNSEALSQSKEKTARGTIMDVDLTVDLVMDQTAVHGSVVDMILKKVKRPARRVVITGSHTQSYSDGHYLVPKQELIGLSQARLETKQLKFAKALAETPLLVNEFVNYQHRKTNPMLLADPWREHESDDLVLAVALACWGLKESGFSYEFL